VRTRAITGQRYDVEILRPADVLWRCSPADADAIEVAPPAIEIDRESSTPG
jgi:hypothetical protein